RCPTGRPDWTRTNITRNAIRFSTTMMTAIFSQLPTAKARGLVPGAPLRDVWRVDSRPTQHTNVLSSDCIGMASETTRYTGETSLRRSVLFRDMPTSRASAGRVARIYEHDLHACTLGLVADECAQLMERPAMQSSALRLPGPHPRANAFELFQGDCTLCALSRLDKLFADRVVDVFGEAPLLACQFAQAAFGALGALLLQLGAQTAVPIAHVVHALTLINCSIRVGGDIDHAQIDAEHVVHVLRVGIGHLARYQQIP